MIDLEEPDACESCGDEDFNPNWLPEGQCYCDECAFEYWLAENELD
jgi:hypothetical protein